MARNTNGEGTKQKESRSGTAASSLTPDARSLWSTVLGDLQMNLPRSTFEAWLKPTVGVAFQGDQFIVVAQTPFAVEWLERRMFHTLQSTLERVAGRRLQLQLEACNGDDPLFGG